jgi:hypothetical protein
MGNGSTHPRQNHARAKSTNHQRIQELPLHICMLPWTSAILGHKLVRPVPKTGQTGSIKTDQAGCQNRSDRFGTADHTPQKPKMEKKCTRSPLTHGIGSRDAMQLFSPLLPMHESRLKFEKICNLELLKYTKFITRCYTCPNDQISTLQIRNDINFMITKFHNH